MDYRASYWINFQGDQPQPLAGPPTSIVALEPEILGTWQVKVHMAGRQVFALKGLKYPDALESLLGAFEVLAKERGGHVPS